MRHPYQLTSRITEHRDMSAQRVFWDETEKRKVAEESFRILSKDKSLSNLEAIDKAQGKVLKPERRRPMLGTTFSKFKPWIEPMWDRIGTKKGKQATAKTGLSDLFLPAPHEQPEQSVQAEQPMQAEQPEQAAPPALPESAPENTTVVSAAPPPVEVKDFDIAKSEDRPDAPKDFDIAQREDSTTSGYKDFDIARSGPALVKPSLPSVPPSADEPRHMVRWVDSEKMTIARGVVRRMKPGGIERLDALRATIELDLPDYRRREINTWHMVEAWIEPMMKQAKHDLVMEEIQEREAREQAARDEEARIEAARLEELRIAEEAREREQEIERRANARVAALSFDALIRAFAKKLAGDMLNAIREELHSGMMDEVLDVMTAPSTPAAAPEPPKEEAKPVVIDAPKLPKVMVVGLFPNQETDVEKAFRGSIDFDFVKNTKQGGNSEGGHAMLRRGNSCEVVLIMSDSAGLDVEQKRKQMSVPVRRIAGSTSNLKRWLTGYLNGGIDLKVGEDNDR